MLQNYFITARRNIVRNKLYSIINIGGLAIGLATCLLILLFVRDEVSYDKWIPNVENLYAVESGYYSPGRSPMEFGYSSGLVGHALVEKIPEVIASTRIYRNSGTFTYGDKIFRERTREVDANFFEFFDFPMISGNRELGLADNLSMLINEDIAKKYFGDEDPVGKILTMDIERSYKIAGVFKNLPANTHFEMEIITLFDTERYKENKEIASTWGSANVFTYIKLQDGTTQEQVTNQLKTFVEQNAYFNSKEAYVASDILKFNLFPVSDLYLHSEKGGQMRPGGDIMAVYTFSAIAILILIIASINFMNLSMAQSMKRAREVSIRKVVGSSKNQLVVQFLGESIIVSFLALLLALALVKFTLPFYNEFISKDLTLDIFSNPIETLGIFTFTLMIGFISGIYPAFFLSNFCPSKILGSNNPSYEGGGTLRHLLVVFQFSISIALIVSTLVVYGQTLYVSNMDKGFTIGSKLNIYAWDGRVSPVMNRIKQELKSLPGVHDIALANDSLPQDSNSNVSVVVPGVNDGQSFNMERTRVGPNFHKLYGAKLLAGRLFSEDLRSDYVHGPEDETLPQARGIIINKSFLAKTGFATPHDAIGKTVNITYGRLTEATIVGVIKDIHSRSLRTAVTPLMYWVEDISRGIITVDLHPEMIPDTMRAVEAIWKTHMPEVPLSTSFVDEDFSELYTNEELQSQMFAFFAIFAVFISCLGLYALASFTVERRRKEIGIRKFLGADVWDIVKLLVWQFSKPVMFANLIAWPVAWFIMQDWLNGFEYRIDLNPILFIGAGLLALTISWLTVGGHVTKIARKNPIFSLRYE